MIKKHKVGDELFFVHNFLGSKTIKIKAVGRTWVALDVAHETYRFSIDDAGMNVMIPNYGCVGRCYPSEQAWLNEKALDAAWSGLKAAVSGTYVRPKGVTIEGIAEARKLLGLGEVKA